MITVLDLTTEKTHLVNPIKLLGESMNVYLHGRSKEYEAFLFKATSATIIDGKAFIEGYDIEFLNLRIDLNDIEYIVELRKG